MCVFVCVCVGIRGGGLSKLTAVCILLAEEIVGPPH